MASTVGGNHEGGRLVNRLGNGGATTTTTGKMISAEDLREYFECPICFVVPRKPPIYACQVGHFVCSQCRPKLTQCPTCRVRYPRRVEQSNRLYFAERLLEERVPVSCTYAEFGCPVELVAGEMRTHEEQGCPHQPVACQLKGNGCNALVSRGSMAAHVSKCEYRIVSCPLAPKCDQKIVKKFLMQHLQEVHMSSVFFKNGLHIDQTVFFLLLMICVISILFNIYLMWMLQDS